MKLSFSKGLGAIALAGLLTASANAQVLINEFDTNSSGSEYIELYNAGGGAVDLGAGGYVLVFVNGNDNLTYQATDVTGTIAAGGYLVVAEAGVTDIGGYTPDLNATWSSFQNGEDGIALISSALASDYPNDVDYSTVLAANTDVQEDAVIYGSADPELEAEFGLASGLFVANGSAGASERTADGQGGTSYTAGDWQIDARTAGGDNAVVISATSVADIAAARALGSGNEVIITGTVTASSDEDSLNAGRNQFFIVDASGTDGQSGLLIDDSANTITALIAAGDNIVNIQGNLSTFGDLLQLVPTVNSPVASSGNAVPAPIVVDASITDINDIESELVRINNVTFADSGTFAVNTNYAITESPETILNEVRVEDNSTAAGETIPAAGASVIGFALENFGDLQLQPRTPADIIAGSSIGNWEVFE